MDQRIILVGALLGLCSATHAENLTPNEQRYANKNPDATGQSGAATLSVRALLAKNGITDVDVTAGRTDGAAPGNLARLLFSAYNSQEHIAWSKAFANLASSTFHTTFEGMKRGQPLQTQATIRSADGKRSDVVVTSSNVRLRPDLFVLGVEAPPRYRRGEAVAIVSTIHEANGDTGAIANCCLRVNDFEVDRAEGIWVDAGGTVACAFRHTFDVAGSYNLEVVVDGVQPGDWDDTNNRATSTIQIDSGSEAFNQISVAYDFAGRSSYSDSGCYVSSDGSCATLDYEHSESQDIRAQFAFISGSSPTPIQFPLTLDFSGASAGIPFADDHREIAAPTDIWDDGYMREERYQAFDYATGMVYAISNRTSAGFTGSVFVAERYASDITYYSSTTARDLYSYEGSTYFYSTRDKIGDFWPMASTVSMTLIATDAASHTWTVTPTLAMAPQHQDWNQSQCEPWVGAWGTGWHCQTWEGYFQGTQGVSVGN